MRFESLSLRQVKHLRRPHTTSSQVARTKTYAIFAVGFAPVANHHQHKFVGPFLRCDEASTDASDPAGFESLRSVRARQSW